MDFDSLESARMLRNCSTMSLHTFFSVLWWSPLLLLLHFTVFAHAAEKYFQGNTAEQQK